MTAKVESDALDEFSKILGIGSDQKSFSSNAKETNVRINVDADGVKNGLAQLVLALINLLHELLERQALHRIDGGSLTDEEVERVGMALMGQSQEIERLRKIFNLEEEDLNLNLGPLGKLL